MQLLNRLTLVNTALTFALPPQSTHHHAGFIFTFYGMYVTPINYPLTAVNILLCGSSGWHLGRKIKADYL